MARTTRLTARRGRRSGPGILAGRDKPFRTKASLSTTSSRMRQISTAGPRLILSLDYGTSTASSNYCIVKSGETPELNDVVDLYFSNGDTPDFVPQSAAWPQMALSIGDTYVSLIARLSSKPLMGSRVSKELWTWNSSYKTMSLSCGSCCFTGTTSQPKSRSS